MPSLTPPARDGTKSATSDELINTYVMRPLAGALVRRLVSTSIRPDHLTFASGVAGCLAAALYLPGLEMLTMMAGLCVTLKDLLDTADGQLARAQNTGSRAGRFLDSLVDVLVNVLVFTAFSLGLFRNGASGWVFLLGAAALAGTTMRVSYHVFYQTSYLHLHRKYELNRVSEQIQPGDALAGHRTLLLQRLYQTIYGWQDRLMIRLDLWCRRSDAWSPEDLAAWYSDPAGLRLSGLLGLATELFVLTVSSVLDRLDLYLALNIVLLNAVWAASIFYRRVTLGRRLLGGGITT